MLSNKDFGIKLRDSILSGEVYFPNGVGGSTNLDENQSRSCERLVMHLKNQSRFSEGLDKTKLEVPLRGSSFHPSFSN